MPSRACAPSPRSASRSFTRCSRKGLMDFAFSPEQDELIRTLRGFARKELQPRSAHWDKSGEFPWEALRQMGELGLLGLRIPADHGGQDSDYLTFGIAMEEIARGDFACTYGLQLAGLAGEILGRSGSDEVKARWLPSTARGETIVALALTEPGVGSDAANLACRAEREGDGYVITGEKSGISLGMVAQAAIVFARTDRAVLAFDRVRVPDAHRLGEEGTGFYQVMQGFDYNRVGIALACLGVAQVSLEETMAYVKERKAFGRSLATFEGVSFPIAEAATQVDACRLLCYRALWLADRGQRHTKESAMTKWWAPRLAVDTIHQCLLFHGHYGYTDELPFEQRMRDVIGLEIGDGAAEVMKMVVARELMGRESLPY